MRGSTSLLRRSLVPLAVALALGLTLAGRAGAGLSLSPCTPHVLLCGTLTVPLDYSGVVPGQIALHVEELPAPAPVRGVVFLLAGGPGQASAKAFDLTDAAVFWRQLLPGYTIVAYDNRGTGDSGPLACSTASTFDSTDIAAAADAVGVCADSLGTARQFYATRDHVEDMDSIRKALGFDKIAVLGVSYGTKQALGYAILHPDHVDRLILDSVDRPEAPDPFATDTLRGIPKGLASICYGGACRSITADPGGDVARLANHLQEHPLHVDSVTVDGTALLSLVVDADLSDAIAVELPAAVQAANAGWMRPIERLYPLGEGSESSGPLGVNSSLYAATVCDDGPFPWEPTLPVAQRQASIDAAVAALPPGSTGPFGTWATDFGTAVFCREWPVAATNRGLPAGPVPDVPALVLAGDRDMRTPLAGSADVAGRFRQGHLIVAHGLGHSVTGNSGCIDRAIRSWIGGGPAPSSCARVPLPVPPVPRFARSVASLPGLGKLHGRVGRTVTGVERTLREADGATLFAPGGGDVPAVVSGSLSVGSEGDVALRSYTDVPGLALSGTVTFDRSGAHGVVTVAGAGAAHGRLVVSGASFVGLLDGHVVSGRAPR